MLVYGKYDWFVMLYGCVHPVAVLNAFDNARGDHMEEAYP